MVQEKKYCFIYCTINKISNKKYIGSHTTNNLNDGYIGSGKALKDSISTYGKENFEIEILEWISEDSDRLSLEEKWINKLNTIVPKGYNISPKGGLGIRGSLSDSSKRKISEANKGRQTWLGKKHSEESKKKISQNMNISGEKNPFYGKKHSEESIKKIKEKSGRSIPKTDEWKRKIGQSNLGKTKGRKLSPEQREKISKSLIGKVPWNKGLKIKTQ